MRLPLNRWVGQMEQWDTFCASQLSHSHWISIVTCFLYTIYVSQLMDELGGTDVPFVSYVTQ